MALDAEEGREMILKIISLIDYDIYKSILHQEENDADHWNLVDDCMEIVEEYVKVNP